MAIHTQESLSGFIASEPHLSFTEKGDARLFVKIGQEHYRREDDGSFTQTETTFHDLVAFRKTAERAHQRFAKGDKFIAEGYTHHYDRTDDNGQAVKVEEFVAKKLGHDLARTRYTVDRPRRTPEADSLDAGLEDTALSPDAPRRAPASTPAVGR
ncbi:MULTISPECIES: single-stranded DNA-binding protein [Microbacteriaceae]|uniref:Single-strand binding protein/Primosomal replication protein n n=3 Tax=Microbacteriaceae TaxID=85023 RepID=A0A1R4JYS6_9MICO|nr:MULTISPECIES: single-stranded DNA-binding protein [Microbacteriaceae]RLP67650.1 single-stranded DNA-binding protein [Mycetocola reblochoni]TDP90146.1 single-stranded DNA-binding protein [Leucobacter luti]SJN37166.1 single-strand binding protein/Primosomal replication protein n [Mycetocola reblochoni REB411]